jgi:predicted SnoaL-like aldol condensation-catalyzing enzyme
MKRLTLLLTGAALCGCLAAQAQVPPTPAADQSVLLQSKDPKLAANKKLVYDMWRELLEGGHVEVAEKYLTEGYIQHNPSIATGRAAVVEYFSKSRKPLPIEPKIKGKLINIVAEGDIVVLTFVREYPDPKDPTKKYATTWVDMFRVENGKIAEHWDSALKQP